VQELPRFISVLLAAAVPVTLTLPRLNRILAVQELLRYISVLLALQPRLDDGAASTDAQPDGAASSAGAAQAGGGRGGKAVGTLLLLDVEMAAPVITMPRCSDSRDALEVDLGHLQLRNALTWRGGAGAGDRRARPGPHRGPQRRLHPRLQRVQGSASVTLHR